MPAPLGAKCVWDGSFYPPVLGLGPGRATNPETYAPRAFGHFGTLRNKGANKTRTSSSRKSSNTAKINLTIGTPHGRDQSHARCDYQNELEPNQLHFA